MEMEECAHDITSLPQAHHLCLHPDASTGPTGLMNVCDLSDYVSLRLDENALVRKDGRIAPPEGIGLGVAPDPDRLGTPVIVLN